MQHALFFAALASMAQPAPQSLSVVPAAFELRGARARQPLLVTGGYGVAGDADLTRSATFQSENDRIAVVGADGVVLPRGDGDTNIRISFAGKEVQAKVVVQRHNEDSPIDFRTDVIAALSRAGCNQGACHGSPQGKNGFRMSLRGFDPTLDYYTLVREDMGRRSYGVVPEQSLILLKGSGQIAHQGGVRFRPGDPSYSAILRWIAEGRHEGNQPRQLIRLEVAPGSHRLHPDNPRQQLVVRAVFRDATWRGLLKDEWTRDVSDLAIYSVSGSAGTVSPAGLVEFKSTGELTVLVRYLDQYASIRLTYVRTDPGFTFVAPRPANYIDEHVFARQKALQLSPAPLASDGVFLRRVYLDTIGTLPTVDEARAFLDSKDPHKRAKLIDALLARDEFGDFWALKWADVLRGSPVTISERGVHSFHRWLVRNFAEDRPLDQFVRELLTGLGNTLHKPAANFYRVARTPEEAAETVAQLFLGVRVQCARCHNHPFENISQTDYYGLAAFFARVRYKGQRFGLDDEVVYLERGGEVNHPTRRMVQEPVAFGTAFGKQLRPEDDRRQRLADWLTGPNNPYFARALANRIWFHLLGKGIVDPVDDFRESNPPSNPELLSALADDLVKNGFRMKPLMRSILNSHTYQLAADGPAPGPNAAANPERYFTRTGVRMLMAEQILDAVSQVSGVAETFKGYPKGTRAIAIAEGSVDHHFLQAFAKPVRDVTCECAREEDPSLPQMLHLLNNAGLVEKVKSPQGRIAIWLAAKKSPTEIVELIYLATLSRRPTPNEAEIVNRHLAKLGADKSAGLQDLQYALINSSEFLLRH